MNRMKIAAIALATLAIGATSAQAGCKFSQISGKTFAMSATATADTTKYLFLCQFTTSAAGTVALTPEGCKLNYGTDTDFSAPAPVNIYSGALTQLPGSCFFDVNLRLIAAAGPTITGRVAFAGKSMATGNWVSSFGASGTVSIMKQ
jgi:hypothetical protein